MHDINAVQIILVTLVAFLAGCDAVLDERMFYRPIVACTLTGLALGDPTTGIMVGGALELSGRREARTAPRPDPHEPVPERTYDA